MQSGCCYTQFTGYSKQYFDTYYAELMPTISTRNTAWKLNCAYGYIPYIFFFNARAPVAQLVGVSDQNSEGPSSNPGWISMSIFLFLIHILVQMMSSSKLTFVLPPCG